MSEELFDVGMPTPCPRCGRTVDLNDMIHPENCTRCESWGACDNLVCRSCANEEEDE